ncbi:MAG: RNA-binding S4 domain-containing protein [Candidatus Riflebacteria bacterium]|nr:RNA-binding S4 domain-containing protein [Candidatus Riflebacteria bacterium]
MAEPIVFELNEEYIELIKLLKFLGVASSGVEAKMLVDSGEVTVDGIKEDKKRRKIKKGMKVICQGQSIFIK